MFHRRRFNIPRRAPSALGAHASLYLMCAMMLFWTLSEGIVSFIVPLKIEESGVSDTMLGVILGSSSIAGALFDLVAVRLFKDTYYKRIFGVMFALCLLFPLIIMQAATPLLFVLGMIVWGVYYDLRNIGNFDYIARTTDKSTNAHNFGVLQVFQSVGWVLGPIIVGFLVGESVGWEPFAAIYVFLGIAFLCFVALALLTGNRRSKAHEKRTEKVCRRGTWSEVRMMGTTAAVIFPALAVIFMLNFTDAFFWSVGPLFAEHLGLGHWAGLMMTAWSLPGLLLGWHAGKIARKYGKERTAYVAQFLGAVFLFPLAHIDHGIAVIALVFLAAVFTSVAWPAIQGAFADYIDQRPELEKELEGLEDLYTNLGYVVGPMLAGFLADQLGYGTTFSVLGFTVAAASLFLAASYPKRINLLRNGPPLICDVP